jgi:tetratricopeptide (TPR) repeat protein
MPTTFYRLALIVITLFKPPLAAHGQVILSPACSSVNFEQGMVLFEHKNYAASQLALQNYKAAHPTTATAIEASYHIALCALRLGQPDGEEQMQLFIKNYPHHHKASEAQYELGKLYEQQQAYDQAISLYNLVDTSQLSWDFQVELYYRLGYAYLNQKDFDKALGYFNVIKNTSSHYTPGSNYYAGYLALKKEDYAAALADLQRAGEDTTYQQVVPYLIAEAYYQSKRFKELLAYTTALQPNLHELKNQADIVFLTAEAYFFFENYKAAAEQYEACLALQPTNLPLEAISYRLGYALYRIEEFKKALQHLQEVALQSNELAQLAGYYMGLIYVKTNQKNQALAAFDRARHLSFVAEIQQEAAFQYAQLQAEVGSLKAALEALQKFKQDYPQHAHIATVDNLLSQLYFNSHHYEQTIDYIEGLSSKSAAVLCVYQKATFYKGIACFNQEDYKSAIAWLKKSLASSQEKALALQTHLWLAESYAALQAYEQAIGPYQSILSAEKKNSHYHQQALYGIAYAYFYQNNYRQALGFFKAYEYMAKDTKDAWRMDALVRIADCHYMDRSYAAAMTYYDAAQTAYPAHCYYQKALIYEVRNNLPQAQACLYYVITNHQQTPYYEKALFSYAHIALKHKDYAVAVQGFSTFLEKKPYSIRIPEALLYRALAKVNQGKIAEACIDYEKLLTEHPTHPAAQSALLDLSKLLIETKQSEKLQHYLAIYKAANPASQAVETIHLEAAKNLFYSQNYPKAMEQLNGFIQTYPTSSLLYEAYFLLAEIYYRLEDDPAALAQYQLASQYKNTPFYSRILLRLGAITYKQKDFKSALGYYTQLREVASNKKETYYALEGIMKSNNELGAYHGAEQAASLILQEGSVTVNAASQATLYLGKAAMEQQKFQEALAYFKQVLSKDQGPYAAEAQFRTAQIYHQLGDYGQSLEHLFALHKNFSNHLEWLHPGFLLIAENYMALKEWFQARATLQSIIDQAQDSVLVAQAAQKLAMLQQQAAEDSLAQAKADSTTDEFKTLDEEEFEKTKKVAVDTLTLHED